VKSRPSEPAPAPVLAPQREPDDLAHAILAHIDEVVYVVRPTQDPLRGTVEYVSERALEITGLEPAAFRRDPELWFRLLHPEDVPAVQASTLAVLERGEGCTRVYRLRNAQTGEYLWVEDRIVPMLDARGAITGLIGAARDVTGRKRTEEALRLSEERFRTVVDSMNDIVFVLDREQRYVAMLGRRLERYGLAPDSFLGKTAAEVLGPAAAPVHEAANRRALAGDSVLYEWSSAGPEGTRNFQTSLSPLRDARGEVSGITGVGREITALKHAEEILEARARQQEAIAHLGQRALSGIAIETLMSEAVAVVAGTLGVEYSVVLELQPGGRELVVRAMAGFQGVGDRVAASQGASPAGRALVSSGAVVIRDLRSEPRFAVPPVLQRLGVVSGMSVAIEGEERPFGVLGAHTTTRRDFAADDVRFLESVAHVLASAVLRKRHEVVRAQLLDRVISAQEDERRHLARELHDEVGQLLTGLKLMLETGEPEACASAVTVVNHLLVQVRDISMSLRPAMLDDLGLVPALLWLFERFSVQARMRVDFQQAGSSRRFPRKAETAVFRIVQEAMTNVARHATVSEVKVRLWADAERLGARIEDSGRGFEVAAALAGPTAGLGGMRERAEVLGGQLTIESAPGSGTRLSVELPLAPEAGQ